MRYNKHLGVFEARLYVPVKLRHLYNNQRTISLYHKTEAGPWRSATLQGGTCRKVAGAPAVLRSALT